MAKNTDSIEVRATAKYVRVAPRKARAVVALVRGKSVEKALEVLQFSTRAAATDVAKVLRSAVANAENNNGLRANNLVVKTAFVDEGPTLKRIRPRAKGSASRINKRMSTLPLSLHLERRRRNGSESTAYRLPSWCNRELAFSLVRR